MWDVAEKAIKTLNLPNRLTMPLLAKHISTQVGKNIEFLPCVMPANITGWVLDGEDIHILFASNVSPVHQVHIKLHELGHVVLEHTRTMSAIEEEAILRSFITSIHSYENIPNVVLKRHVYDSNSEMEAELFATRMLSRIIFDVNLRDDPLLNICIE